MVELQVQDTRGNIIKYQLGEGRHSLGKSRRSDILLMDQYVSRNHADLLVTSRHVYLRDNRSTNGTWLAGKKLNGIHVLEYGQTIRMGSLKLSIAPAPFQFAVRPGHPCDPESFFREHAQKQENNVLPLKQAKMANRTDDNILIVNPFS